LKQSTSEFSPKTLPQKCSLKPITHNHLQFLLTLTLAHNPAASHALPSSTSLSVGSTQLYGITQLPSPTTPYIQVPSPTTTYTRPYQSFGPSAGPYQSFDPYQSSGPSTIPSDSSQKEHSLLEMLDQQVCQHYLKTKE